MSGARLKRNELVETAFAIFWSRARNEGLPSIAGVAVSLDDLRDEISHRTGVTRQNNKWIATQLRNYEKEQNVRLFSFRRDRDGGEQVRVSDTLVSFVQKKHLHRPEKVRLAAALADLIESEYGTGIKPLRVLLGAGTTLTLAADVIAGRAATMRRPLEILTHNVGILETLIQPDTPSSVTVTVPYGTFDPVTYTLLPVHARDLAFETVELAVQGTSALYQSELYVESEREAEAKRAVLQGPASTKVLVLTLHEFTAVAPESMYSYGDLEEYNLVVFPRMKHPTADQEQALSWLESSLPHYERTVRHWHYEILKRRRQDAQ